MTFEELDRIVAANTADIHQTLGEMQALAEQFVAGVKQELPPRILQMAREQILSKEHLGDALGEAGLAGLKRDLQNCLRMLPQRVDDALGGLDAWCRHPSLDAGFGVKVVRDAVNALTGKVGIILLRHGVLTREQLGPQSTWALIYSSGARRKVVGAKYNHDLFSDEMHRLMRQYLENQRLVIKGLKVSRDLESQKKKAQLLREDA